MSITLPTFPKYTLYTQENPDIAKGTIGTLLDEDMNVLCRTLELPWQGNTPNISCIPEGFYSCVKDNTGKFQYWRVENVSGRFNIEFHNGNFLKQTQGCILVGRRFSKRKSKDGKEEYAVWRSRITIEKLKGILPDKFMLCIIRHRSQRDFGFVPTGDV